MQKRLIIYGEGFDAMRQAAEEARARGYIVTLRSGRHWRGEIERTDEVAILDPAFEAIGEAYGEAGIPYWVAAKEAPPQQMDGEAVAAAIDELSAEQLRAELRRLGIRANSRAKVETMRRMLREALELDQ